ncbi:ABC transporter permease subunit [Azoarcus communis]|uniref:ABC transporter permease n=1 Tax=Parazoarcus communis SWub3 = DSM 12120 TaxID=1121029 RepID=A0A323UVQ5_9RHOO|nr:ABC transporter permease [Parazoarcus communis]NMG49672.1 ABC transporter permease subunit [Parazoarcus communis]NMG70493.1 ABC transporter permease subunit [Parazoarcus communis SWub3 = DSM 12120]PZA17092.1 ABC transporter permease [Azoarcus communis] [Parazoarcus communis SWub3 = DSM 12120]
MNIRSRTGGAPLPDLIAARQQAPAVRTRQGGDAGLRLISLLVFALLWQAAAMLLQTSTLPTPLAVLGRIVEESQSLALPQHLAITLWRVALAFTAAMLIGTAIGIAMGRWRRLDLFLDGWLVLGLNIPALVTIILCYVWFGLNDTAAIVAVAINKIPTVIVTVREGARAIDPRLMQVAQAYRLPPLTRFSRVYLPQLTPYLMAAARSGLSLIWKIVLVVELLGRSNGVGFQLNVFFQFFDITGILAYTLVFAAVVLLIEALAMRPLERRLSAWRN